MNKVIKIIDYPCGSGKTTKMIEGFKPENKYLVVVPYLTEVTRVIKGSTEVTFVEPSDNDNEEGNKTASLKTQLINGQNIATTHSLFDRLVPMAKAGLLDDYDILIDEVLDVIETKGKKSKKSIDQFYLKTGYMELDAKTGLVIPTNKWWEDKDEVSDTLSPELQRHAESGRLYLQGGSVFIRAMPEVLFSSGKSLTIMTYKAEGSELLLYLRKLGLLFEIANDISQDEAFRLRAAELITIRDIPGVPNSELSCSGQMKGMKNREYCNKVSGALKRLRERQLQDIPIENILITCLKAAWNASSKKGDFKPGVFAKGSRLQGAKWTANTTRGTNEFINCSHLIYLYDQYPNPVKARWLGDSSRAFNDAYALTELIQWVWRSRVRKGEPITLYLPSPRMRRLFEEWLYNDKSNNSQSL